MNEASQRPVRYCPECGAQMSPEAAACWLCRRPVPLAADVEEFKVEIVEPAGGYRGTAHARRRSATQFTLASLLLIATLASVLMGLTMQYPGLGIALWVFALPAIVRTWIVSLRTEEQGATMSTWDRVRVFMLSWVGMAVLVPVAGMIIVVAALAAMFVVCGLASASGVPDSSSVILLGAMAGFLTAGGMVILLVRVAFRKRSDRASGKERTR